MTINRVCLSLAACCALAAPLSAQGVGVLIRGTVEFNQFQTGALSGGNAPPGTAVSLAFRVSTDGSGYVDSPNFPARGYFIDQASCALTIGSQTVTIASPYPSGFFPPVFVLRNNDPAADGFMVSRNVDVPQDVPLSIPGFTGSAGLSFLRTFNTGDVLDSLEIGGAIGEYGFENMSSYDFSINVGPGTPMGIEYQSISIVTLCSADIGTTGGQAGPDGLLNNNDFIVFIDRFFAHDVRADIGTTGGTPGSDGLFNNNDFIVYIDRFFQGC